MSALQKLGERAAARFLQSVVVVDDEIYERASGKPVDASLDLKSFPSPFLRSDSSRVMMSKDDSSASGQGLDQDGGSTYLPRDLVDSFAELGIACALYEPRRDFPTDPNSVLYKLCDRADVVILDWDLYNEEGENILPLVKGLASSSQSSVPHQARLCVIYTNRPDLSRVTTRLDSALRDVKGLSVHNVNRFVIDAGATRVVILGKPNAVGRPADSRAQEVHEANLAARVVKEFATMNQGILSTFAIQAMAEIRRNTKRILEKFDSGLDGPFMVNRALLIEHEDAFDQLPELFAEELLAVMQDSKADDNDIAGVVSDYSESAHLDLAVLNWKGADVKPQANKEALARKFLLGGRLAVKLWIKNIDTKKVANLHSALGCDEKESAKKLASLFNVRTRYARDPVMQLGTIIRTLDDGEWVYSVCIQPLCDGVRLSSGSNVFPFWRLVKDSDSKGIGIVLGLRDGGYSNFVVDGKPRDRLWLKKLEAGEGGVISAVAVGSHFTFDEDLEWVAQLKPAHAQRIVHDVAQKMSRVGLIEAEWLRRERQS